MDRLKQYFYLTRFDKPIGILLLLWPTLIALWLASNGHPSFDLFVVFCLGTVMMRAAGCAINDFADRDFDRHVKRTAQRPVTRGALSAREALLVVEGVRNALRLSGYAAAPGVTRATAAAQVLVVNGRPVADPVLRVAVRVAYRDVIAQGRHPVVALFLVGIGPSLMLFLMGRTFIRKNVDRWFLPDTQQVIQDGRRVAEAYRAQMEKSDTNTLCSPRMIELAELLKGVEIQIPCAAGDDGRLFGSITTRMIADHLKAKGYSLDKKLIVLEAPIRTLGSHKVTVRVHPDAPLEISVVVVSQNA